MPKSPLLLFFTLFLFSCSSKEIPSVEMEEPTRLLPRDSFVLLLSDVHLAESFLTESGKKQIPNMKKESSKVYELLFRKYHLSRKEFQDNFSYYSSDAKTIQSVYKEVLAHLHDLQLKHDSITNK